MLIPAFALGRAQEVLLILRRALAREGTPAGVRIHADGMVRAICGVYQHLPTEPRTGHLAADGPALGGPGALTPGAAWALQSEQEHRKVSWSI
jgi:hypothetical protein